MTTTPQSTREKLYTIIFEADTKAGKAFDISLLLCIVLSVVVIMLESVSALQLQYGDWLRALEWIFTIIFTAEYLARIWTVRNRLKYVLSFYGILDLIALLPSYIAIFIAGTQSLMVIRSLRLIRMFRILKLSRYVGEGQNLLRALRASQHKITVFLVTVISSVIIAGTVMYLIEGAKNGFTDIPTSIYWAVVTMTTVGYGDIAPKTGLGQGIASIIMILGYGIIAVPTGIVSAEMVNSKRREDISTQVCMHCYRDGHDPDAVFCKYCGNKINS